MIVYLALAAFPIFLGIFFPKLNSNKKQRNAFFFLCGIVMLLVMGLRSPDLGSTDTQNYYNAMARAISSSSWHSFYEKELYEVGLQFFIFVLSRVFKDPQWLLVITSLIFVISIFYFVRHNSDDIALSVCAYISLGLMQFHLQGMRQSLAMCICLFAYEQAKKKHLFRFVLLVLLAVLFHQTAIVFFPVYILCQMKFSLRNLVLIAGISGVAMLFSDRIVGVANDVFERDYTVAVSSGGFIAVAVYVLVLAMALIYYAGFAKHEQSPLLYVLIIGMSCFLMRYTGTLAAERISFYFVFSQIALLPKATAIMAKNEKIVMRMVIVVLALSLFAYRLHGSDFVPYQFFWQ